MPRLFDEATVSSLLTAIDTGRNVQYLKYGYFMARRRHPMPVEQGYSLLIKDLAQEPVGSRKWYEYQELAGFASFHMPDADPDGGYLAYMTALERFLQDRPMRMAPVIADTLADVGPIVVERFPILSLNNDPRTAVLATDAWKAGALVAGQPGTSLLRVRWTQLAQAGGQSLEAVVRQMYHSNSLPRDYGMLVGSAGVLSKSDSKAAVIVLERAKPLLPTDNPAEVVRFYRALSDAYRITGSVQTGVRALEECVARTGRGRPELADMYRQSGQSNALHKLLQEMAAGQATPDEAERVAGDILMSGAMDAELLRMVSDMLSAACSHSEHLPAWQTLHIRYLLGLALAKQQKYAEATAVLSAAQAPQRTDWLADRQYERIQSLAASLAPQRGADTSREKPTP
jgi:hypothetical protein